MRFFGDALVCGFVVGADHRDPRVDMGAMLEWWAARRPSLKSLHVDRSRCSADAAVESFVQGVAQHLQPGRLESFRWRGSLAGSSALIDMLPR